MRYSGRVSVDVAKQPHILINEEVGSDNKQRQKGNEYQLSVAELVFCKEESRLHFDESCVQNVRRSFSSERKNKTTGKLDEWKGHTANTGGTVSSVVVIKSGPCVTSIGQIKHFVSLQHQTETIEFVNIDLYANSLRSDNDSGLLYIDTRELEEKVFHLDNISKPMVTALDDENSHVMWVLNSSNV